ncbi:MAG: hypothetical protein M3O36_17820, partial [Myxococcota bacterium]|nr:hypothetical protein [Myxococcota bacterium]
MKHFSYALVGLAAFLFACSSPAPSADAPIPPNPTPVTHFDAQWKPATVILNDATIQASLINRIADDGVYHFRSSSDLAAKLVVGKVVLMTGVNLVTITKVDATADTLTIETQPAALQDAADNAHLDWHIANSLPMFLPTMGM